MGRMAGRLAPRAAFDAGHTCAPIAFALLLTNLLILSRLARQPSLQACGGNLDCRYSSTKARSFSSAASHCAEISAR